MSKTDWKRLILDVNVRPGEEYTVCTICSFRTNRWRSFLLKGVLKIIGASFTCECLPAIKEDAK